MNTIRLRYLTLVVTLAAVIFLSGCVAISVTAGSGHIVTVTDSPDPLVTQRVLSP